MFWRSLAVLPAGDLADIPFVFSHNCRDHIHVWLGWSACRACCRVDICVSWVASIPAVSVLAALPLELMGRWLSVLLCAPASADPSGRATTLASVECLAAGFHRAAEAVSAAFMRVLAPTSTIFFAQLSTPLFSCRTLANVITFAMSVQRLCPRTVLFGAARRATSMFALTVLAATRIRASCGPSCRPALGTAVR